MRAYELGQYEKSMPNTLTWKEKLQLCREFGFDYLEMSVDESDEKLARLQYTKEEREAIVRAMEETGVRIHSMCLSGHRKYPLGHPDEHIQKKALQIMEAAVQLADGLGIRIIQLAGYDVYYEEGNEQTRQNFIRNLRHCVELAAKRESCWALRRWKHRLWIRWKKHALCSTGCFSISWRISGYGEI